MQGRKVHVRSKTDTSDYSLFKKHRVICSEGSMHINPSTLPKVKSALLRKDSSHVQLVEHEATKAYCCGMIKR